MHRTNRVPRAPVGGLVLLGLLLVGLPAYGQAVGEAPPPKPAVSSNAVVVPIGGVQRLQMTTKKAIRTITNENDRVAAVLPLPEPNIVLVRGLAAGITRVTLTDVDGKTEVIEIVVQFDIQMLVNLLQRAVPTANVTPIPGTGNTIILAGTVAHAEDIDVIMRIAQSVVGTPGAIAGPGGTAVVGPSGIINALRVGGVQQVQLDVCVARVNRSKLRRLSFEFSLTTKDFSLISTLGGAGALTGGGGGGGTSVPASTPANIFFSVVSGGTTFLGFLQALKDENVAKLLSKPSLVTLSGRPASFTDGGDQAVPDVSGIGGTAGVRFEPFGTRLNFLPIVLGNGKIYLEVEPEVSALDAASGTPIPNSSGIVPGRLVQRVHTSVMMEDGQTLAIGGLIQHTVQASSSKIPVLGEIPFVGAAFSKKSFQEVEEEVVVLVTPHLVDPMDCGQAPRALPGQETRSPDDFELFLEGILEAPRGPREVFQGNSRGLGYEAAYKNDPTAKIYPCGGGAGLGWRNRCNGAACQNGVMPPPAAATAEQLPTPTAPMAGNDAGGSQQATAPDAAIAPPAPPVGDDRTTLPPATFPAAPPAEGQK